MENELTSNKNCKLIITIVKKGMGSKVVGATREAGAQGGTIVFGRGIADENIYLDILSINYDPEKEVIFTIVSENIVDNIFDAITEKCHMEKPGRGIAFMIPLKGFEGVCIMNKLEGCFMKDLKETGETKKVKPEFDLIITIVNKGDSWDVVEASKKAGAEGGTIIGGRGTGIHENLKILGIPIEPEKEIVLTLIPRSITEKVLDSVKNAVGLDKPGRGIAFVLDVEKVVGISHLLNGK
ncbi:MAG TPA: PII family protein [Clostridiaceae bacterium]|nr:PII family protein [Clostridiaceae bacterium]